MTTQDLKSWLDALEQVRLEIIAIPASERETSVLDEAYAGIRKVQHALAKLAGAEVDE